MASVGALPSLAAVEGAGPGAAGAALPLSLREGPRLGANLNGRPRRLLDGGLRRLDETDTTWVRAFLDVRRKLANGGRPADDPDVVALRRAAGERGCRLVVSLKFGFEVNWAWDDRETVSVPAPGSDRERALFRCAARHLRALGERLDVVVLGNEPMWETRYADAVGDDPPIVRFTRRLKDHLVDGAGLRGPRYLVGAFNRLQSDRLRDERFASLCDGLFAFAREDHDVDGVDLHVHYGHLDQARRALAAARDRLPDGLLTVTEFSPAHRYGKHVRTPIGTWESGRAFADAHGYPRDLRAVDYLERAKDDPVPAAELGAFYGAMPWYRGDHLERVYRLFAAFDVAVGAFGFVQDRGMRAVDWDRPDWTPFHLNFLYQDALLRGGGAHPLYVDDYRRYAGGSASLPAFARDVVRSFVDGGR